MTQISFLDLIISWLQDKSEDFKIDHIEMDPVNFMITFKHKYRTNFIMMGDKNDTVIFWRPFTATPSGVYSIHDPKLLDWLENTLNESHYCR